MTVLQPNVFLTEMYRLHVTNKGRPHLPTQNNCQGQLQTPKSGSIPSTYRTKGFESKLVGAGNCTRKSPNFRTDLNFPQCSFAFIIRKPHSTDWYDLNKTKITQPSHQHRCRLLSKALWRPLHMNSASSVCRLVFLFLQRIA